MNCQEIANLAPLYLSGEIDASRAAAMDAHLRTCPACLQDLEQQAHLDSHLRNAIRSEAIDQTTLVRKFRDRLASESGMQNHGRFHLPMRRRWLAAAAAAAALLLLVGGGYRVLRAPRIASVCADAAQDHLREIVEHESRTWLVAPAEIAALAERQGISGATVLSLAPGNFRLGRARLCFLDRHVFLHLVYSNGAQEVSLFLRQRNASRAAGPSGEQPIGNPTERPGVGNERMASFETPRLTAVVVTDESAVAALQFAQAASATL